VTATSVAGIADPVLTAPVPNPAATPSVSVIADPEALQPAETAAPGFSPARLLPYIIAGLVLAGLGLIVLGRWLSRI
jgi:hypothetical protein